MKTPNAADAYRSAQFDGAPPIKILQMLNAGAIRFLKTARDLEPTEPDYRKNIHSAEEVVIELRASLNHDPNPELSANLESLYLFIQRELSRAVLESEPDGIDASIRILETLLAGWKEAGTSSAALQGRVAASQKGHVA